ncbi:tannase/feruloyl esterase family alpha/beta hydrolase [Conservatibacter flavescens]|uniref:Tannase/feruloyl esterase family alpha/beta hydrolase n=1 Tax=Conservatibacter flavescens TaxID=28161 RepID=A0A2M8S4H6_9PAST|nr:tannase/feruloyl esterase family alpha/beta hydrolase [Conservatibacter flavescens]PJG86040.1 tannase/feruloyl esterase family alpha/beta hydrolase [Conservatibacter flavescens]
MQQKLLTLFISLALSPSVIAQDHSFISQCEGLKNANIYQTVITKATFEAAAELGNDKAAALSGASGTQDKLVPHCLIEGEISPRIGVNGKHYGIQFQLRLPQNWNNKFLYQGGGGMDGFVGNAIGSIPFRNATAQPALQRGYAVVSTDSGHQGRDASFAEDQQARLDYAYAAIGKVSTTAKQLIISLYQSAPQKNYFMGCSNGGRAAMLAAQRFPTEFDGIVAGNPGFRLSRAALNTVWETNHYLQAAPTNEKGEKILANALTQQDFDILVQGVLKQCDAKDGLKDGIINAWEQCDFTPEHVADKFTPEKLTLIKAVFGGAKNSQGEAIYTGFPFDTGIAAEGWRAWKLGDAQTAQANSRFATMAASSVNHYFMTPFQPHFDLSQFNWDKDVEKTAQTAAINDAVSTDLSTFVARGGKMIIIEGVSDPVFSALDQRDWFKQLLADNPNGDDFAKLFMIPGMNHCGQGPALDNFDPLTILEDWAEKGENPQFMLATGKTFPNKTQPICAYPKVATYIGGDENQESSFRCK